MCWTVHSLDATRGTTLGVFLDGLSDTDAAEEAYALLGMLEKHGSNLRAPLSKALGDGLFEARGLVTGIRLFFVFWPDRRIIVLDGYVKKRTKIPATVMAHLRKLQKDADRALHRETTKKKNKTSRTRKPTNDTTTSRMHKA